MVGDVDPYDIFRNKKPSRVYLSKAIEPKSFVYNKLEGIREIDKEFRIVSKVFDSLESHQFVKQGKELVLRVTEGQRQEVVVKFYEDTRGIFTLQIQKFSVDTGTPHNTSFTFIEDEINKLYSFLKSIALLPISSKDSQKFDEDFLEHHTVSKGEALKLLLSEPDLILEILNNDITKSDIIALGYRKAQLEIFRNLLEDNKFFEMFKSENNIAKDEAVWQFFFEKNTWIFGYGLNYIFNTSLDGRKLEQVVSGYNCFSSGKRIDALMKTKGIISSLCFGEIKTHTTPLLGREYRPECFPISTELAGGIAQVQKTVQKSLKDLETKLELKDEDRNPTGNCVFLYQPKSFLVIGSLNQFSTNNGINEDKFSSFELYRRQVTNTEIITFDELYQRAKYIVASNEVN